MDTFIQLFEVLDRPYPTGTLQRWSDPESIKAYRSSFETDDGSKVVVQFKGDEHIDDYDELDWDISFQRNGSIEVTGEGDALRIMATVVKIVKDFIKQEKPKYANLQAAKIQKGAQKVIKKLQGRERLYNRLIQKEVGNKYKVTKNTGSSGTIWYLTRKI